MKECIVVLGMHRSGTSVLSGLVSVQGFYLGADVMPVREDNPKGFFENMKVYQLNQSILEVYNTSWDDYSFVIDDISPNDFHKYVSSAKAILKEEFGPFSKIFIKDPRMCLLFPLWEVALLELGYTIKVILAYRSPEEVSHSLKVRNGFALEKSLLIWSHYFFQAEVSSRKYKRMLVHYSKDFKDLTGFLNNLGEFLDVDVTDDVLELSKEIYTHKLTHHKQQLINNISSSVPSYLNEVIKILANRELSDFDKFDSISSEFYNSTQLYLYDEVNLKNNIESLKRSALALQDDFDNEKNKLSLKINQQQASLESAKKSYTNLHLDFGKIKGNLEGQVLEKNAALKSKDAALKSKDAALKSKDAALKSKDAALKSKDAALKSKDAALKSKDAALKSKDAALKSKDAALKSKDIALKAKTKEIENRGRSLVAGEEVFHKVLTNPKWNKKISRSIIGGRGYELKKLMMVFSKNKYKKLLKEKSLISGSGFFSPFYYLTKNIDVWEAGVDPLHHFCLYGWKEGRSPSRYFNCKLYLKLNPDVEKSGMNPLLHYLRYGKAEGRDLGLDVIYQKNKSPGGCQNIKDILNDRDLPIVPLRTATPLVSIIVLTRDGLEYLKILIPALIKHTEKINYELIVVDNNSKDGSMSFLKEFSDELSLIIISNSVNETFSKANNKAAEKAKGKYLLLLNNDVEPMKGWLDHLVNTAENEENVGSVGACLVYPFKKGFEKSCKVQHAGIAFRNEASFFRPYNQSNGALINSPVVSINSDKCSLTAACLLVRADIYNKVGGFDEGYNYGFEDVDLGLKIFEAGYRNIYCSDSISLHYEFGTQDKNNRQDISKRREENAKLLHRKWTPTIKKNYWAEKLLNKSHYFAETPLKVALAVTDYGQGVTAGDYFTALELAEYLEGFGWTVIYLSRIKNEWYQLGEDVDVLINLLDAYDLSMLPDRNAHLVKIAWARNWFDKWCSMPCFGDYDIVFASSKISCDYVKRHSQQDPILLPIASNPKHFLEKKVCDNPEFFESDICFTGSYWNFPRDIMHALSDRSLQKYRFNIYGANWGKFDRFTPYNKGFISYSDIAHVYHHTKIVIDDANHVTKPYGAVNSRIFDALMSGALVITNGVEGAKDLFSGELPFYKTSEELDELLDFYLNDDDARIAKVQQLKSLIINEHTYQLRAESIREALVQRYLSASIAIKIPCPAWHEAQDWGDYHMAVLLKEQLESEGYYVLLQMLSEWGNNEGDECDVVIVFRGLSRYEPKPHQLNFMWNISHPDKVTLAEYEEYDKVFIASELWANKISEQVSVPVVTMLQCTDPSRFKEPTVGEKEKYNQELLFVGNSRNIYRKVIKDIIPTNYKLAVYGKGWGNLIPDEHIKGDHISNAELFLHYGSADILLNDHWDDMREKGFVSNRIYDGLACGAFIITDDVKALGDLKDFVQTYETPEMLKELLDYYMENPQERSRRSKKGIRYILENHTFKERAKTFSESIQEKMPQLK